MPTVAPALRVRCYRNDSNLIFIRAVVPEYSISSRCSLFCVGLENLFAFRTFERGKFMGSEAGMPWIA